MANNIMHMDTSGLENLLRELDKLGGDVRNIAERSLKKAAVQIMNDTLSATMDAHLPAHGKYSQGQTMASVIHFPKVVWEGNTAYVPIGFDFGKPGAGGFLISGTPRMAPDKELNRMYKKQKYMSEIQKMMGDEVMKAIVEQMEKG